MVNKTLVIDNHNNSGLPGYSGKSPIYISCNYSKYGGNLEIS